MLTTNTASDVEASALTMEKLRESMRRMQEIVRDVPPPVRIIESALATKDGGRVRTYPKRRAKSESHWRRMDKKWRKRYGFHRVPCAYWINQPEWAWPGGRCLVAHPAIAVQIRAALR